MVSVDHSQPYHRVHVTCGILDQVHAGDIDLCPEYQRGSTLYLSHFGII